MSHKASLFTTVLFLLTFTILLQLNYTDNKIQTTKATSVKNSSIRLKKEVNIEESEIKTSKQHSPPPPPSPPKSKSKYEEIKEFNSFRSQFLNKDKGKKLTINTNFQIRDKLVDRRWDLDSINFQNFPNCSNNLITYYIKSDFSNGYHRRQNVRTTWATNASVVFISFSQNLENHPPDANSTDILLTDSFPESADLLSIKIALGIFHANKCSSSHAVFTDDDVHFFTDKLEKSIEQKWQINKTEAVRGLIHHYAKPIRGRGKWSKYSVTLEEYPYKNYPWFSNGSGYIASKLAIQKLFLTLPYTKLLRHVDDVYFGLLVWDADVNWQNDKFFTTATEHARTGARYPCGLYNLHGFVDIDKFEETMNEQCNKKGDSGNFKVVNWQSMIDPGNSLAYQLDQHKTVKQKNKNVIHLGNRKGKLKK